MLAAISTTILSRRSCALTGSAITSRSRRNSTRGPPSVPAMANIPQGRIDPTAIAGGPCKRQASTSQLQVFGLPSRIRQGPSGLFVEPIERMQRAHRKLGVGGVDQD